MTSLEHLQALCMDLKRVAIGYHRGSIAMGDRFLQEVQKRKSEIASEELAPYMQVTLGKLDTVLTLPDKKILAEQALMYSTIIQNYCIKHIA